MTTPEPYGTDEALLGRLRLVVDQLDPVPSHLAEGAKALLGLRRLGEQPALLLGGLADQLGQLLVQSAQPEQRLGPVREVRGHRVELVDDQPEPTEQRLVGLVRIGSAHARASPVSVSVRTVPASSALSWVRQRRRVGPMLPIGMPSASEISSYA